MTLAIDEKVIQFSIKLKTENDKNKLILKDIIIPEELKLLHNKFIVAPSNNGCSNVASVCQRHWV